jgi:uncharacterized protein
MIRKEQFKDILITQKPKKQEGEIQRDLLEALPQTSFVTIITGIRRCGKSTLLKQIMRTKEQFLYVNLEDQRLFNFELEDFMRLEEAYTELYGEPQYYFFDEIQEVDAWEKYIRHLHDKQKKVFITGSNASLLSKELGTKLTGRHMSKTLFPFSYKEFLRFKKSKPSTQSFTAYLEKGGFPSYLQEENKEILQQVFKDILYRDIIVRFQIRNEKALEQVALFLISNIGKKFSYTKLASHFGIGSTNSVIEYISHFEKSYILFTIPKFDYSLKKQQINPKKAYAIDLGLAQANSLSFTEDKGRMLENLVFLELKRKGNEVFYFEGKKECDFVIKQQGAITNAIQACYELTKENEQREIDGLIEALHTLNLKEGMILTYNQEDKLQKEGKTIHIKPVWKWLTER